MDLAATATPRKPLFTRSLFLILALAAAPIVLAWVWATGPGFGNNRELMILFLPFMIVLATCFGVDTLTKHPFGLSLLIAPIVSLALLTVLAFTPSFNLTLASAQVKRQLWLAEKNLGQPAAIAVTAGPMLDTPQEVAANLSLLDSLRWSNTNPDSVTAHVATAGSFGVDASFVRDNGMVRKQDAQALLVRAQQLAKAGDRRAEVWLEANRRGR